MVTQTTELFIYFTVVVCLISPETDLEKAKRQAGKHIAKSGDLTPNLSRLGSRSHGGVIYGRTPPFHYSIGIAARKRDRGFLLALLYKVALVFLFFAFSFLNQPPLLISTSYFVQSRPKREMPFESAYKLDHVAATRVDPDSIDATFRSSSIGKSVPRNHPSETTLSPSELADGGVHDRT